MRTVAVVTGSRADFGIYRSVLRAIESTEGLQYRLIVCGAHLSEVYGSTVHEIESEGFTIAHRVVTYAGASGPEDIVESMARTLTGFASIFSHDRPDIVLVLGDRYEMFAAVAAALSFALPLAHIHGGELSEGAIDDAFRHAITKMCHIHFVSNEDHARRVVQLGEEPERVHVTGAPGLDNLSVLDLAERHELEQVLGLALDRAPIVATFHPVTLEPGSATSQFSEMLASLDAFDRPVVLTYPNADAEGASIIAAIDRYVAQRNDAVAVRSLGTRRFFGLMRIAAAMVGNSSSGIIEAASFGLPVVNIGDRQRGRMRGRNVVDVVPRRHDIVKGLERALEPAFRASLAEAANPYGDGRAGPRIAGLLRSMDLSAELLKKKFHDTGAESISDGTGRYRTKAYG